VIRIGIDVGGTKLEGVALTGTGTELGRLRVPTPRDDYVGTLGAVVSLVAALEQSVGRAHTLGIGIPGALSPVSGMVKNANATWLNGRPFDRDLQARLGRPVRIANDANCFTVSEAVDGAGVGAGVVFGVILGTGVGGGIAVNGQLLVGINAIAGEWGHNPLPWPEGEEELNGPRCYCGRSGCIETFLSGPGFAADFARSSGRIASPLEIAALGVAGDETAHEALVRYESRLARALATVINLLDPDIIVLGGGLSNMDRLYQSVPKLWRPWVFSDSVATRLQRNRHGDSSGVRGAAWLWPATETGITTPD
jgi:Transcriptional regulator/sugar kinase